MQQKQQEVETVHADCSFTISLIVKGGDNMVLGGKFSEPSSHWLQRTLPEHTAPLLHARGNQMHISIMAHTADASWACLMSSTTASPQLPTPASPAVNSSVGPTYSVATKSHPQYSLQVVLPPHSSSLLHQLGGTVLV